jgi:signal peptidase I
MSEHRTVKCTLAAEVLRSDGTLRLPVAGRSMFPALRAGDVVVVDRTDFSEVSKGDIVLFTRGQQLCAHRVVTTGPTGLLTQGDTMPVPDGHLKEDDFLGRVSFVVRDGRCMLPRKTLKGAERIIGSIMRRSEMAARVVVRIHSLLQPVQVGT